MSRRRRIVVVAHAASETNRRLAAAFDSAGASAAIRPPSALARASHDDLVLARLDVLRSLDGIEPGLRELAAAAERGVPVLNGVAATIAAHDKLVTARCLAQAGLPHPWTTHVFGETPPVVPLPVVLKPRFGSWGYDVHRCLTRAESKRRFRELGRRGWAIRQGILVQDLVESDGTDLRVVVAGGRVVGAAKRVAAPGEWRTNLTLGGTRLPAHVPAEARALALAAAGAIGGDLVGIDLLPRRDGGWSVIEINAAVEFTTDYALEGRDPFRAAADAILGRESPAELPEAAAFSAFSG